MGGFRALQGVLDRPDEPNDPNAEFVFGLESVLNGIDTLVQERAPTDSPGWLVAARSGGTIA